VARLTAGGDAGGHDAVSVRIRPSKASIVATERCARGMRFLAALHHID
jgi:hypothetical protein